MKRDFNILRAILKSAPKLIKQEIYSYMYGVGVFKHNFMYGLTNEVMEKLIQTGIHQYFCKYLMEYYFYDRVQIKMPKVFTVDDLRFGFVVWIIAVGIAIAVFVCELMFHFIKKWIIHQLMNIFIFKLLSSRLRLLSLGN